MAQRLHQQPRGVAARALAGLERLLRRLHARLHADHVADAVRDLLVHGDQEVDDAPRRPVDVGEEGRKMRAGRLGLQVDREIFRDVGIVGEGIILRAFLDEKVERVVDRHVGDDVDLDLEFTHGLGEDEPGHPVPVRVLLMVDEVVRGRDLQRMRNHPRARMRRGAQPDDLGPKRDGTVVLVVRQVVDCGLDRHGSRVFTRAANLWFFTLRCDAQTMSCRAALRRRCA